MLSAMGVPVNKNIPSAQDQVIKIAALSAESFKELFYSVCDAHRDVSSFLRSSYNLHMICLYVYILSVCMHALNDGWNEKRNN